MRRRPPSSEEHALIERVQKEFVGVTLGDGIGLHQAEAMDSYASEQKLLELRKLEETDDWSRVDVSTLNQLAAALSFLDAQGMKFYLPAYLMAELRHQLTVDLLFHLTCPIEGAADRFALLNSGQRGVVRGFLTLVLREVDDFCRPQIEKALTRYWSG